VNTKFKAITLWLHTWSGMTIGLAMLFLAITGAGLALRPALEIPLNHHMMRVPACTSPLSLDSLAEAALQAQPGTVLDSIEWSPGPRNSIAVILDNGHHMYVDPCSGDVLGVAREYSGLFGVIDWLHRARFLHNGKIYAGIATAGALLFVVIGGIILWWPNNRTSLRASLRLDRKLPGIAKTINLHKVLGTYTAAVLLVLTLTGLPIAFEPLKQGIGVLTHSGTSTPAPPSADRHTGTPPAALQDILEATLREIPGVTWLTINCPEAKYPGYRIEVLEPGAPHKNAKSYVYFDAATGDLLGRIDYKTDIPLGRKIYLYILATHLGLIGGLPYQLILCVSCLAVPAQTYTGFSAYIRKSIQKSRRHHPPLRKRLKVRISEKLMEADRVCRFELVPVGHTQLPAFDAGAHIEVALGPGLVRHYSLCNSPSERSRYEICVLRDSDGRGGSRHLHDQLNVGDTLDIGEPRNHFPLAAGDHHTILIAGGIGITPIICMAEELAARNGSFDLHFAGRSVESMAFVDRLSEPHLAPHVSLYSNSLNKRMNLDALLSRADNTDHVYVCGPAGLVEGVVESARQLGLPDSHIHFELFKAQAADSCVNTAFEVQISSTGKVIQVSETSTVIEALESHGIQIPMSCREGVCGACIVGVLKGEIDHRDVILSEREKSQNDKFTPCCSRAKGGLLIIDL